MKNLFSCFLIFLTTALNAQILENQYDAQTIPDDLEQDATVVIRKYALEYFVKSAGKATYKEHLVATLLKDGGASSYYATPRLMYDKLRAIKSLQAFVYDANGKLVKQLKKSDIVDTKLMDAWVDDDRYKVLNFPHLAYPYTIEYKIEYEVTQTMYISPFLPQRFSEVAVQDATFKIATADGTALRYKEININKNDNVIINGNDYSWHLKNIKAFKVPSFTPITETFMPQVLVAPTTFGVGNYKGDMTTWNDYGKFMYTLNQHRQELPPQTVDYLKQLVSNCTDTICMVEKIYTHLQNMTRYFSIQLGIGGWQTIIAKEVDHKKYGDCKGLSNYMVAMLAAVGVKGHCVVIRANDQTQYEDFPNPFFNHEIACVPVGKDTIWLECTNQTIPFGYLGSGTDNRLCLLFDEKGGKAVLTPKYDEKVNTIYKTSLVLLDSLGNATIQGTNRYAGIESQYMQHIFESDETTRKKHVYYYLDVKHFDIKNLNYKLNKTRIPSVDETFDLSVEKLASVNGKRLFLPLNLFSVWTKVPSGDSTRLYEVQADDRGVTQIDSVYFQIPAGFKAEIKYVPVVLENEFGSYEMNVTNVENRILFYRKMILNNKILPKEKITVLNDFLRQVIKADKSKLVLVKN
ncbi:MAG: hypothetical protein RIS64_2266 [Bacteroidota bacterium]